MVEHKPVLLQESIAALKVNPGGVYLDATFGRGGHSREILNQLNEYGQLIVIDKDPTAIATAKTLQAKDPRVIVFHGSFSNVLEFCEEAGVVGQVNGILADLGVSSPQLDNSERGFSFMHDGPLDMRMDTSSGLTAAEWLQNAEEKDIADTIYKYGEERFSRRIARAIIEQREAKPLTTTLELANLVAASIPKKEKHKHPATRTFQALRIKINNELNDVEKFLEDSITVLASFGRLAVISFHSLEDRIVKQFIAKLAQGEDIPFDIPIRSDELKQPVIRKIGKAIKPTADEIEVNVRSRSAVLRVAEKQEEVS